MPNLLFIELIHWLIFSVIIAVLPLLFKLLSNLVNQESITIASLCSRGELLLVSVTITARAHGELLAGGTSLRFANLIVGGFCIILLILASFWFADISCRIDQNNSVDGRIVTVGSIIVFVCAVILGGSCLVLTHF
jgi:hypothetical protein